MSLARAQLHPKILPVLILCGALMVTSCATILRPSTNTADVNNETSVVFGRSEFVYDGLSIDYRGRDIVHHVKAYTSDNDVSRNPFRPGDYSFFSSGDEDGYFAIALPPGKYYFVEFAYLGGLVPGVRLAGIRTFMRLRGTTVRNPYIITFDVPANKAVYIGTVRHDFWKADEDPSSSVSSYVISPHNEFEAARKWFLRSRASLEGSIVESVAVKSAFRPVH